jgi:hypothetical protein
MAALMVYKRNSKFIDLSELVEDLSSLGLTDTLQKYYNKPLEKQAKSIVGRTKFPAILEQVISNSNYSWRYYTFRIWKSQ